MRLVRSAMYLRRSIDLIEGLENSCFWNRQMNKIVSFRQKELNFKHNAFLRFVLKRMNKNFDYPDRYNFNTDSKMWESYGFGIKSVGRPSDCIRDLFESKCSFDCERAALAIVYYIILEKVGDTDFNNIFKNGIKITSVMNNLKIPRWLDGVVDFVEINSIEDAEVGDWLYFESSPRYLETNSGGCASGEHVICSSTNPLKFIGLLDKSLPLSYEEWLDVLYENAVDINYEDIKGVYKRNGKVLVKRICV